MTRQFLFSEKSRTNLTLELKWESVNKRGRRSTAQTCSYVVLCVDAWLVNSKLASQTNVLESINKISEYKWVRPFVIFFCVVTILFNSFHWHALLVIREIFSLQNLPSSHQIATSVRAVLLFIFCIAQEQSIWNVFHSKFPQFLTHSHSRRIL